MHRLLRIAIVVVAPISAAATVLASPPIEAAPVRALEDALAEARVRSNLSAITDVLDDEYRGVDRFGQLHTRDTALVPGTMSVCESVHLHGTVAVVVAREGDARVLRVWIMRHSRWQLVAEQKVLIQPGRADPEASWTAADVPEAPPLERPSRVRTFSGSKTPSTGPTRCATLPLFRV